MPSTPSTNGKKRRRVRRVIGKLDPKALYTREGCMRFRTSHFAFASFDEAEAAARDQAKRLMHGGFVFSPES